MRPASLARSSFERGKALAAIALAGLGFGAIKLANIWQIVLLHLSGGIAVLAGMALALVVIGRYILGPLDAAARHRRRPTQFTMADFLALMFLFQLPIALIRLAVPRETTRMGFLYGFAWVASSLMWGLSVQTLSRAGIAKPWHRVVFLSAVLPIAYFGSVVFLAAVILGCVALIFYEGLGEIAGLWWFVAIGAGLPVAFYWAAGFVRTMVVRSQEGDIGSAPAAVQENQQAKEDTHAKQETPS